MNRFIMQWQLFLVFKVKVMCILERFKILKSWCILASLAVAWDISTTRTSSLSHNRSTTHTSCCRMWISITQNYKMESLAFLSYKLIKTMFLTKAYKSLQKPTKSNTAFPSGYLIVSNVFFVGVSKNLGRFYQCKLPLHPSRNSIQVLRYPLQLAPASLSNLRLCS